MTFRPIKTAALLLSICALGSAAPVWAQTAPATTSVTITFKGLTKISGAVRGQLYADEAAYGGKGEAVAVFSLPVAGDSVSTTVPNLAPGRYAVKAFHDVDGDGKMGANPFGIPTEPFAFSNDAKGAFGPAAWADAAFEAAPGETVQTITID